MGDRLFFKMSLMKGFIWFRKKGKLSPRFVRPFKITQRLGKLAYRVALPSDLTGMHDVFHVSMLRKYIPNPNLVVEYKPLEIEEGLTYKEMPIHILDHKKQLLRTKTIPIVKVLWWNHLVEEASWKATRDMRNRYPHLFENPMCMISYFQIILNLYSYRLRWFEKWRLRLVCFPDHEA